MDAVASAAKSRRHVKHPVCHAFVRPELCQADNSAVFVCYPKFFYVEQRGLPGLLSYILYE